MDRIGNTAFLLDSFTDSRIKQGVKRSSVHHELLRRAMAILENASPEYAITIMPMMKYMLHVVKKPDRKGDFEKGMGRHYYCSIDLIGNKVSPVCGYYKNALGHFGKSARSMLEEDHTMALTMYSAGFIRQASGYLARAVHMLCDICCLPHASAMTYFSPNGRLHHAYEKAASYIYPQMMYTEFADIPPYFTDRHSFANDLNIIAETIRSELPDFYSDPVNNIITRLMDAEYHTAALLKRFAEDVSLSPEKAHYITDGMKLQPFSSSASALTVRVTENGLILTSDGITLTHNFGGSGKYFSAAHRKNGSFTISPARCISDKVLTNGAFKPFDPRNKQQFYRISN